MTENIRNICIIAHIDAGKTSVSERFLYYSGKTHKIGEVDTGNTVLDYLDEERERGITIVAASASFEWKINAGQTHLIHLIDTPGHIDFTAEVERSLRVIDGTAVIFSGVEGVEAQSEKVWRQSEKYRIPKIAFINKLDRSGASFSRTLSQMKEKFPDKIILPLQFPCGEEDKLEGIIDILGKNFLRFAGEDGAEVLREDETAATEKYPQLHQKREEIISAVADFSDETADFFINEKEPPEELLRREIRRLTIENKVVPVFCGSAKKRVGIQPLLDAVVLYLPSPMEKSSFDAWAPKTHEKIQCSLNDPEFRALVFKITALQGGDLLYVRTYSGKLKSGDTILNPRTGEKIKAKRILRLYAKNLEALEEIGPGDIVGITGTTGFLSGDTLCSLNKAVLLEKISFPEPVISLAVEPKSVKDKEKLDFVLKTLCREDPTLSYKINEHTGQRILSGMGELHLEINSNKIKNDFNLNIRCGEPQVAYRESLTAPCLVKGVFDRTIADVNLFAETEVSFEPLAKLDAGIDVSSERQAVRAAPNQWIQSAEDAVANGLKTGGNFGYPLIYVKAVIKAIRGNEACNEIAVAGAALDAVSNAVRQGTKILEPLVKLEIISPDEFIGDISGFLQSKRAAILGMESFAGAKKMLCEVPLAEMFGFGKALPKLSGGRASFTMEPSGYQELTREDLERRNA